MKNISQFWKSFFEGFLNCYSVLHYTNQSHNLQNIRTFWLRVSGYLNTAYKDKQK